jgi:mono/diheme cytochrome c family protein
LQEVKATRQVRCGKYAAALAIALWWAIGAHGVTAWPSTQAPANTPAPTGAAPDEARSVWDGVFTEAQARRGEDSYLEECAACHSKDLAGGDGSPAPALAGDAFLEGLTKTTVGDFFERVRTTMPLDSPGRLSPRRYADIVAYIFKANRFPVGARELDPDIAVLGQIRIENRRTAK